MKSILKNKSTNIQRSSSLDTKCQAKQSVDKDDTGGDGGGGGGGGCVADSDHSCGRGECRDLDKCESFSNNNNINSHKKRALIRDEHGVCRPGELDEDANMEEKHESRLSVVDRSAAERISYRLVQQRSLDYGLYRKLNNFNIDSSNSSSNNNISQEKNSARPHEPTSTTTTHEPVTSNDVLEGGSRFDPQEILLYAKLENQDMAIEDDEDDIAEVDDEDIDGDTGVYSNPKIKELGKEFTLKDILAHRVPELEVDNCKDEED
ncbi:unnamed protein product [Trichobilharzia szidati]|nr:unnamed protein product [Trichobilharzia szidati]